MDGDRDAVVAAGAAVGGARRQVAIGHYRLANACLTYSDARRVADRSEISVVGSGRPKPGEFVADELAMMLRQQPWHVRCLVARSGRIRTSLPTVWESFGSGDVDAEQVVMIDRIARRSTQTATQIAIDDQAVGAAQTLSPKQLGAWLLRLIVRLEPEAFAARHRRALAYRRVTIVQGPDGIGYVTGEMTAGDAAAVDALLAASARGLGADDPRTEQQRRADIFTDLLLGRLRFADEGAGPRSDAAPESDPPESEARVEVENVDLETGELLGTRRVPVDADGCPLEDEPAPGSGNPIAFLRHPQTVRVGIVVPLSSLLGLADTPGELVDRSGCVPADAMRETIAGLLASGPDGAQPDDQVLFTRLLTDDGGRLLQVSELGRFVSRRLAEAIRIRAGTCCHPTCTVPADRCDLDHEEPHPQGPTSASNQDPKCRRHHRGKTFAWLASVRDGDTTTWTLPDDTAYRVVDDPLPTGIGLIEDQVITEGRVRDSDRVRGSARRRRRRRPRRARSRPAATGSSRPCLRRRPRVPRANRPRG